VGDPRCRTRLPRPARPNPAAPWFPTGWDQVTRPAAQDNPVTNTHTLDIHDHGIPALTPHWTTHPHSGDPLEAYDLHDYLYQHHQTTRRYTPTRQQLWDTLTTGPLTPDTEINLADDAENRGLYTAAITLLTPTAAAGDAFAQLRLADLLAERGDMEGLTTLAAAGDTFAQLRLADLLAERGDMEGLTTLAAAGDTFAQLRLADLLAERGDMEGLTTLAAAGKWSALDWAAELVEMGDLEGLAARADADYALDELLAQRGDVQGLAARTDAGDEHARYRLVDLLAERGDVEGLRRLVWSGVGGPELIGVYRSREGSGQVVAELDCLALPVLVERV
jgi:hypothetical protein